MLALPIYCGCGRLLAALALAGLGLPASVAAGRPAWAQEVSQPPGAEVERLFREYERLTRIEPRQVEPSTVGRQIDWNRRPRGDFWIPGDRQRLFGR